MSTYVVTGASGGLGFAFIKLFASEPDNTVIGIVRDKLAAEKRLAEAGVTNVTIYQANIIDLKALKAAAAEIQNVFGAVDYLICNAAYSSQRTLLHHLGEFSENPDFLENELELSFQVNVIGLINTINTFIPLVRASSIKKIVALTSGMGDCDFVNESGIDGGAPYAISKAGVNMVVAKYNATYKSDGVLVMGICAGSVNTHPRDVSSDDGIGSLQTLIGKLMGYAPHFAGPVSPEKGAKSIMKVVYTASLENGSGGSHVSYMGTSRYL